MSSPTGGRSTPRSQTYLSLLGAARRNKKTMQKEWTDKGLLLSPFLLWSLQWKHSPLWDSQFFLTIMFTVQIHSIFSACRCMSLLGPQLLSIAMHPFHCCFPGTRCFSLKTWKRSFWTTALRISQPIGLNGVVILKGEISRFSSAQNGIKPSFQNSWTVGLSPLAPPPPSTTPERSTLPEMFSHAPHQSPCP